MSQQPWEQMRFLEHSDVHAEQASGRKQTQARLVGPGNYGIEPQNLGLQNIS